MSDKKLANEALTEFSKAIHHCMQFDIVTLEMLQTTLKAEWKAKQLHTQTSPPSPTSSYLLGIPPHLRSKVDYVFLP